jgi:hypothetical protein
MAGRTDRTAAKHRAIRECQDGFGFKREQAGTPGKRGRSDERPSPCAKGTERAWRALAATQAADYIDAELALWGLRAETSVGADALAAPSQQANRRAGRVAASFGHAAHFRASAVAKLCRLRIRYRALAKHMRRRTSSSRTDVATKEVEPRACTEQAC